MSYDVVTIPPFDKRLKRLAKKYPSLKSEYSSLIEQLQVMPNLGIPLGNGCYKIRIAIASKSSGKSGGGRVITCVKLIENTVFLLSIFDKSEQENIPDDELGYLLTFLP